MKNIKKEGIYLDSAGKKHKIIGINNTTIYSLTDNFDIKTGRSEGSNRLLIDDLSMKRGDAIKYWEKLADAIILINSIEKLAKFPDYLHDIYDRIIFLKSMPESQ